MQSGKPGFSEPRQLLRRFAEHGFSPGISGDPFQGRKRFTEKLQYLDKRVCFHYHAVRVLKEGALYAVILNPEDTVEPGDNTGILTGLGAMTAVLILVFKDSILGFVASMQLSMNDMVRIGDWIEMPKFGADGDVIDVTLHTVKVQNWDKTITTIPSYALISDSFKNWRGMSESGGRRIKRAVNIDVNSIRFCDEAMLHRFEKNNLLKGYLQTKQSELTEYNTKHGNDPQDLINARHLTNVGTFRAYMVEYLKNHPNIHQNMTFLVRQLPPGEHGLPIELYVFSNDQDWVNYEGIQSDIFDHLLAIAPQFGLRIFQRPSGADLEALARKV